MHIVTLANGHSFNADHGVSLLDAARVQNLVLEHGCRTGRCGLCKAHAIGATEVIRTETSLTEAEQAAGMILTCCRAAASDLALNIEDLGALADIAIRILPCRISAIDRPTSDIARVTLRTPPGRNLSYLAGQYIDVIRGAVRRSYSIANAPRADGTIELHIKRVIGGAMSAYWFKEARVDDLLRLEGPLGTFFQRSSTRPIVLFATGTGIAPAIAMLEAAAAASDSVRPTTLLFWGNRTDSDIYWHPDAALDVDFIPVLSRAMPDWQGARGWVQHVALARAAELAGADIYACGSPVMIEALQDALDAAKIPDYRLWSDAFLASG